MTPQVNIGDARRFIELIAGPEASIWFRLIHDKDKNRPTIQLFGTLSEHLKSIEAAQKEGYGVFIVINEGGNRDVDITHIRAVFIDADNTPLPISWHLDPDCVVQRDANHWHAYWIASNFPVIEFRQTQRRLAAFYGTDTTVCNKSRVMRLPGSLHQKDRAVPVQLVDQTEAVERCLLDRDIEELTAGLPELSTPARVSLPNRDGWPITRACLEEKLRRIDPFCDKDRNKWIAVAGALKHATTHELVTLSDLKTPDPSFDGLATFTAWSAGDFQ
jgi:RepB DNA-primase from phage plasmid